MLQSASKKSELELYKQSVIRVTAEGAEYDYSNPWQGPSSASWSGSGFIVNYQGQKCIITNAHVSADAQQLDVRIASDDNTYPAKVFNVDHDCDLAMLTVEDPAFWEKAMPLELGDMPAQEDELKVVGFPMGGKELCITRGIVSRSEVGKYCHSGVELLHTQVSAEINPGNSGGPAIFENKVLGVAFQGIMFGDGLGYIIPAPVLRHFVADSLSGEPYKGFPHLAINFDTMTNPLMREDYGMKEGETGIRIKSVDRLSSASNLIKADDILLAIDGKKVKNDATIETELGGRIKFIHAIRQKSIGENITLSVLRKGERLDVEVPLLHRCNRTKLAQREWDKAPTFYINSGVVFSPVTFYDRRHEKYRTKSKKNPGDEKVMIHSILSSEHTRNLGKENQGSIIKTVNGQKIRNLREAIKALEGNEAPRHRIETKNGGVFVFKNLTKEENNAILKAQRISQDRSEDLTSDPVYSPGCPEYQVFAPMFQRAAQSSSTSSSSNAQPSQPTQLNHKQFDQARRFKCA